MRYTRFLRNAAQQANNAAKNRILVKPGEGDPTGITGLYTHPNPRPALIALYDATLKKLEDFPSTSVYRQSVENITKSRKEIVEKNEIREVIEEKVGAGLIEEVLVQAGEELELIKVLGKEQPWENLMEEPHPDQWKAFDKEL